MHIGNKLALNYTIHSNLISRDGHDKMEMIKIVFKTRFRKDLSNTKCYDKYLFVYDRLSFVRCIESLSSMSDLRAMYNVKRL